MEAACLFVGKIADKLRDGAVQDKTEGVQSFQGDILPLFYPVEGIGGDTVLEDKLVFGHALFQQSFIKNGL